MFYVFHGDDEHSLNETLSALLSKQGETELVEANTLHFEGSSVTFSQLQHACDSVPFLAKVRVVIVSNLLTSGSALFEPLLDYLPKVPDSTRLVLVESKSLPANHPMVKLAEESSNGFVRSFQLPEGRNLERWIRTRVKASGGRISTHATQVLAENVGSDLHTLDNEIEKLVLYKDGQQIEADDVSLLCSQVAEASIFKLVDALGNRNGREAASQLQIKFNEGADPYYLFAMIVRQYRLLIQVKELADEGSLPNEIAKSLSIHNYVSGKLFQQSQNYTMPQLEQIYGRLLEVDVDLKTGHTDITTALNLIVAGVSL
jgi:DNA polymerase-3 subunit delta